MSHQRRGANAIEFALTMPVFFGLIFATIDYGWYFANQAILDIAVHNGCRAGAMVDPLAGDPDAAASAEMNQVLAAVPAACANNCAVYTEDIGEVPARSVRCTVRTTHTPFMGLFDSPTDMSSQTVMRFEWQR